MDKQAKAAYYESPKARLLVLINICISGFITSMSLSATLVAIPQISTHFNADAIYVSWIPIAYLSSNLIMLLPAARLADIYGRKRFYVIGTLIFVISNLLAAYATSIEALLIFRVAQGIGAAMFFSTGMAILSSVYRTYNRGSALGWLIACIYTGLTIGPFIGGWLTENFGWHSIFLYTAPVSFLSIVLSFFFLKGEWKESDPVKVDWFGTVLLGIWVIFFLLSISDLTSVTGLIYFSIFAVFLSLFLRHTLTSSNPIVKLKLVWQKKALSRPLMASVFMYGGNYGNSFLIGIYSQYNLQLTPSEAGQLLMIMAFFMAVLSPFSGRLSDRYSPKLIAYIGSIIVVLGTLILIVYIDQLNVSIISIALAITGIGFGLFSTPNSNAIFSSVDESKMSIVSSLLNIARLFGQMLGMSVIALSMSIFIGKAEIDHTQFDSLTQVLFWTLSITLVFAMFSVYFNAKKVK